MILMKQQDDLYILVSKISDKSIKIRFLLNNAIYKNDSERETFLLVETALSMVAEIEELSETSCLILEKLNN